MVKVVSWNIGKREKPWRELVQMASEGAADVALLQEAGSPPGDVVDRIEYVDGVCSGIGNCTTAGHWS